MNKRRRATVSRIMMTIGKMLSIGFIRKTLLARTNRLDKKHITVVGACHPPTLLRKKRKGTKNANISNSAPDANPMTTADA